MLDEHKYIINCYFYGTVTMVLIEIWNQPRRFLADQ